MRINLTTSGLGLLVYLLALICGVQFREMSVVVMIDSIEKRE